MASYYPAWSAAEKPNKTFGLAPAGIVPHELARIKYERITRAIMLNLDSWIQTVADAEQAAIPGNKARLLHLQRNMMQARAALERLMKDAEP